ncbi:MAG: hypothetical protein M9894_04315 [Planctomycetes bacterium]|nr:hypothetical protein [Planctomycetota bacterium]
MSGGLRRALGRARGLLWPPAERAIEAVGLWGLAGAAVFALFGLVVMLVSIERGGVGSLAFLGGAALAGLAAPLLGLLSASILGRAEAGRGVARALLPPLAVAVVWLGGEAARDASSARKFLGWSVFFNLIGTWAWVTLGRPDVRPFFGPGDSADQGPRPGCLGLYAAFLLGAVGGAFAIKGWPGPGPLLGRPLATLGLLVGAGLSGSVAALAAALLWWRLRGPTLDLEQVPPEAWRRILDLQDHATPAEIASVLAREGHPAPGPRWTQDAVIAVLRAEVPDDDDVRPPAP